MDDVRIALVTGANKGIGFETARGLAAAGLTVLLGARDEARGAAASGEIGAVPVRLDVTDAASVAAAVTRVTDEFGRLDVLVNNAGVLTGWGRPADLTAADLRTSYEVNVFGVVTVTRAFLPLLRRSAGGRIVNVSSGLGSLTLLAAPDAGIPVMSYSSAKAALNGVTLAYAADLRDTPVTVVSVDPGLCATDLNHRTGTRTAADGAAIVVRAALGDSTGRFIGESGEVPW
ncbi:MULTISPECIES: SDR family NAD(P)-dependent oxidoreductase [Catenuloplanes]|uniref:NAD(P)-dependent dehydrogenase (Short-subunit alcohol dehydrogenase family) n=1 Tax=Catenuloplanes niger TaxID=587534 RepID=A0AAE3ZP03_9ACTN|nr:SDR family NAD(P)-dependent oxidoreductase [Catenuloplanes niger]MDR7322412.1 NAD(P)-dependent dehydrogenase (short-subunit alcohol dehydrogenase family) [Catenuloplanes niger]